MYGSDGPDENPRNQQLQAQPKTASKSNNAVLRPPSKQNLRKQTNKPPETPHEMRNRPKKARTQPVHAGRPPPGPPAASPIAPTASSRGPSPWAASPINPRTRRYTAPAATSPLPSLSTFSLFPSSSQEDLGFARSAFVLLGPSPNPAAPASLAPPLRASSLAPPRVSPQTPNLLLSSRSNSCKSGPIFFAFGV